MIEQLKQAGEAMEQNKANYYIDTLLTQLNPMLSKPNKGFGYGVTGDQNHLTVLLFPANEDTISAFYFSRHTMDGFNEEKQRLLKRINELKQ